IHSGAISAPANALIPKWLQTYRPRTEITVCQLLAVAFLIRFCSCLFAVVFLEESDSEKSSTALSAAASAHITYLHRRVNNQQINSNFGSNLLKANAERSLSWLKLQPCRRIERRSITVC